TFESTDAAVTISLSDVDRDNDLDIVVARPLSGDTLGVWLNDGNGNFSATQPRELPHSLRPTNSLESQERSSALALLSGTRRSPETVLSADFTFGAAASNHRRAISRGSTHPSTYPSGRIRPRAPPQPIGDFRS